MSDESVLRIEDLSRSTAEIIANGLGVPRHGYRISRARLARIWKMRARVRHTEYARESATPDSAEDAAHDVLAAEAFAMPAADPSLHHGPVVLPEDPTGIPEPHDVLAAEEFPMPAARAARGEPAPGRRMRLPRVGRAASRSALLAAVRAAGAARRSRAPLFSGAAVRRRGGASGR